MEERDIEQMGTKIQEQLRPWLTETVREAVASELARTQSARAMGAARADERNEGEIRHLIRLCDQLGVIRAQLESRAGRRRRFRNRWRVEINAVTRVINTNFDRLGRLGVAPMPYPERIDYARHEPVHVYQTGDPSQDGRIVDVVRLGFMRDGRPWRLMLVDVVAYRPELQNRISTEKEN